MVGYLMATVDRINGLTGNLGIKAPVRCATTANITLSGLQTIDGITVVAEDRVLVKNQTDTTENGIYIASSTAWTRSPDFDGNRDIVQGTLIYVKVGTINASALFKVAATDPIVIGDSNITFADAEFSSAQTAADVVSAEAAASEAAAAAAEAAASAVLAASTLTSTSVTSNSIGTGTKTFTTQANKQYQSGQFVTVSDSSAPSNYMIGQVTSYNTSSGELVLNSITTNGSGTITSWNISVSGTNGGTSGAMIPISTNNASGASTVDFTTGINSSYNTYLIIGTGVISRVNDKGLQVRFQQGGSFVTSSDYVAAKDCTYHGGGGATNVQSTSTGNNSINMGCASGVDFLSSTTPSNFVLTIYQPSVSNYQGCSWCISGLDTTSGYAYSTQGTGTLKLSAATTGVRFLLSSANITGTFKLYGIT